MIVCWTMDICAYIRLLLLFSQLLTLDLEDPVHATQFFFFSQGAVWRRSSLSAREFNASAKTHGIVICIGIAVWSRCNILLWVVWRPCRSNAYMHPPPDRFWAVYNCFRVAWACACVGTAAPYPLDLGDLHRSTFVAWAIPSVRVRAPSSRLGKTRKGFFLPHPFENVGGSRSAVVLLVEDENCFESRSAWRSSVISRFEIVDWKTWKTGTRRLEDVLDRMGTRTSLSTYPCVWDGHGALRCRGAVMMHDGQGLIRSLWSRSGFMDVAGWANAWMNGWAYREIGVYAYILAGESEMLMFGCSESIGACMRIYRPFSSGSGPHCDGRHATPILSRIPPLNFISVFLSLQMTKFANLRPPPQ